MKCQHGNSPIGNACMGEITYADCASCEYRMPIKLLSPAELLTRTWWTIVLTKLAMMTGYQPVDCAYHIWIFGYRSKAIRGFCPEKVLITRLIGELRRELRFSRVFRRRVTSQDLPLRKRNWKFQFKRHSTYSSFSSIHFCNRITSILEIPHPKSGDWFTWKFLG
jgi:hypothetical protein